MSKTMQLCRLAIYWTTYSHFLQKLFKSLFGSEIRCPSDPKWAFKRGRDGSFAIPSYDKEDSAPGLLSVIAASQSASLSSQLVGNDDAQAALLLY